MKEKLTVCFSRWWTRVRMIGWAMVVNVYRIFLWRVTVVTVTGSCGKTTTKDVVHHVLSSKYAGVKTRSSLNRFFTHANAILRTRPWHRFCVLEAGAEGPGTLDFMVRAIRPDIGIVLTVGLDHYSAFRSREAVAQEKEKVISALPRRGLAVLNADDPLVLAMADRTKAGVVTFGESSGADIRAENVRSSWPDRLSFDVVADGKRTFVQTKLCGKFWITSILPAFAVGQRMGMSVEEVAAALATVGPSYQRMWPNTLPDGVTYLLDDWKSSYWAIWQTLEFLAEATASRKILVLGSISDHPGAASKVYRRIVSKAVTCVDQVIVTGPKASLALNAGKGLDPERVLIMPELKQVADYLHGRLLPGSLILLKGVTKTDHLQRLMHHHIKPISCWSTSCRIPLPCLPCAELYREKQG